MLLIDIVNFPFVYNFVNAQRDGDNAPLSCTTRGAHRHTRPHAAHPARRARRATRAAPDPVIGQTSDVQSSLRELRAMVLAAALSPVRAVCAPLWTAPCTGTEHSSFPDSRCDLDCSPPAPR